MTHSSNLSTLKENNKLKASYTTMKTTLDKKTLVEIETEIKEALSSVEAKYGIDFKLGKGTYNSSGTYATLKVDVSVLIDGTAITQDVADLITFKKMLGLSDTQLKHPIKFGNENFFVYGYKPRANKLTIGLPNKKSATHEIQVSAFKAILQRGGVA